MNTNTQSPPISTTRLAAQRNVAHMRHEMYERLPPGECFKRWFYGGLGLWCAFLCINIMAAIVVVGILLGLGIITLAMFGGPQ